jgi:hypothetical protein
MLARFEQVLRERDAAATRELFWEAGMIGQVWLTGGSIPHPSFLRNWVSLDVAYTMAPA